MADQDKPSYLDENLTDEERDSGHTRLPSPETEKKGASTGQAPERAPIRPDRPDESGDGDRRS